MSRTKHPRFRERRYRMADGHYVSGRLLPLRERDAEDVVLGELEYRDVAVPSLGLDYTSVEASAAAWDEACTVHHRRPARRRDNAVTRRLMKRLKTWKHVIISIGAGKRIGGTEDPPFPVPDTWWTPSSMLGGKWVTVNVTIDVSF